MSLLTRTIARELQISPEELIQRSLKSFLEKEIRAVQMDIGDFQDRYDVQNPAELRAHIEQGKVYSHPAWEEAIEWERLEDYLSRLQRLLLEVGDVQ
jgi:hypothetical protein